MKGLSYWRRVFAVGVVASLPTGLLLGLLTVGSPLQRYASEADVGFGSGALVFAVTGLILTRGLRAELRAGAKLEPKMRRLLAWTAYLLLGGSGIFFGCVLRVLYRTFIAG